MMNRKIVLVRSPRELIENGQIGYGWAGLRFSDYKTIEKLLGEGIKNSGYKVGRKTKQIKRYFGLEKGDLVIVPVSGAIAIAVVDGEKTYKEDAAVKHGENRIKATYLSDKNGNVFIPRKCLTTEFQSRLKIRMSVANFGEFSDEVDRHVEALKNGEIHTWEKETEKREEELERHFKVKLLDRLRKGENVGLRAGGYGLEQLVKELLEIKGYQAKIQAKNKSSGIDDVDVVATRENGITPDAEGLLIQVKHHKGLTGSTGLKQLEAYDVDEEFSFFRKVLITTAELDDVMKNRAENSGIVTMDGNGLVNWIYDNIEQLRSSTRMALGISSIPALV
jgi:restriction system protein